MIINLTQHKATPAQLEAGVVDLVGEDQQRLIKYLTFDELPSKELIELRAGYIARMTQDLDICYRSAMIGGAPFLMSALETALREEYIEPVYAFSVRNSVERHDADGKVIKENVFVHLGFVSV